MLKKRLLELNKDELLKQYFKIEYELQCVKKSNKKKHYEINKLKKQLSKNN